MALLSLQVVFTLSVKALGSPEASPFCATRLRWASASTSFVWDPPRWSPFPVSLLPISPDLITRPHRWTPEPRGTRTRGTGSPEWEPGDSGTVRRGTREPGHTGMGHRGNTWFRNPDMVSRGPASCRCRRSASAGVAGGFFLGQPCGAQRGQADGWQDRGDNPTPPARSAGLSPLLSVLVYERLPFRTVNS